MTRLALSALCVALTWILAHSQVRWDCHAGTCAVWNEVPQTESTATLLDGQALMFKPNPTIESTGTLRIAPFVDRSVFRIYDLINVRVLGKPGRERLLVEVLDPRRVKVRRVRKENR